MAKHNFDFVIHMGRFLSESEFLNIRDKIFFDFTQCGLQNILEC